MLFVMLRDTIGSDAFDQGLRAFWSEHRGSIASWDDLRAAFERASQRDLAGFFAQWLDRAGAPDLRLESATGGQGRRRSGAWSSRSARTGRPTSCAYPSPSTPDPASRCIGSTSIASVPRSACAARSHRVRSRSIRMRGCCGVLRPAEAPPILRRVMLDPTTVTVLTGADDVGESLARRVVEHPLQLRSPEAPPPAAPLLLVGLERDVNRYLARHGLPPRPAELDRDARSRNGLGVDRDARDRRAGHGRVGTGRDRAGRTRAASTALRPTELARFRRRHRDGARHLAVTPAPR